MIKINHESQLFKTKLKTFFENDPLQISKASVQRGCLTSCLLYFLCLQINLSTYDFRSGIEETVTELDDLLHAIILLLNDFKNKPKKQSKSQYQKGFDKRELAQNEIESGIGSTMTKENLSRKENLCYKAYFVYWCLSPS